MRLKLLDTKDLAILRVLDKDVRASYSEIGRKTRLSKEVVQYRIKKLEDEKIITGYWAIINQRYASVYKVLIKNRSLSGEKKQEFIQFASKHKIVSWFAETEGNWDFIMTITSRTDEDFIEFFKELNERYSSFFQRRDILKSTSAMLTNEKYLNPEGKFLYAYSIDFDSALKPEDKIDETMMNEISMNSRIKFTEMAAKLKMTSEAISYRYRNIMKKGLINGLKMRLDIEKLGLSYYHLFVSLQDHAKRKEMIAFYKQHPACNSILEHIGYYDMHIELMIPENNIDNVMDEFLAKFGNSVSSYELLRIRKEHILHMK